MGCKQNRQLTTEPSLRSQRYTAAADLVSTVEGAQILLRHIGITLFNNHALTASIVFFNRVAEMALEEAQPGGPSELSAMALQDMYAQ